MQCDANVTGLSYTPHNFTLLYQSDGFVLPHFHKMVAISTQQGCQKLRLWGDSVPYTQLYAGLEKTKTHQLTRVVMTMCQTPLSPAPICAPLKLISLANQCVSCCVHQITT